MLARGGGLAMLESGIEQRVTCGDADRVDSAGKSREKARLARAFLDRTGPGPAVRYVMYFMYSVYHRM